MRSFLTRAAAAAAVLVVALPVAASAEVDEYAAEASTTAVRLSVLENQLGSPVLDLVGTDAFGSSDPMASASVEAIEVLGESIGEVRTATSEKDRVRDPESGDGCAVPISTTGLEFNAICALASARAGNPGDTGNQDATASTQLTNVLVNGSLLSNVLTSSLEGLLTDTLAPLGGDAAINEAIDAFTPACQEFLDAAPLGPSDVDALLEETPEEFQTTLDTIGDVVLAGLPSSDPCSAILRLSVAEITEFVIDVQPLADALAGVDLVQLNIDGARSEIAGTDTAMGADANQVFVAITGPSLDFLDEALNAIVQGLYDGIGESVETIAGIELPEDFDLTDDVAGALDQVPLFGITDPLLTATISGGDASADLDLTDGTTSAGGEEPFATLAIAPGVVELLGGDPEQASLSLAAGQSQTIAEGTPAQSTISVGELTVDDAAIFEDTGLVGSRATASVTEVTLLAGVEGGIVLTLAESEAGVYASTATAGSPDPAPDPLPNTGGGAAAVAVLALGAAVALRRRQD